jgi:phage terminase Nu1 subunit (DNA packaging protein)
MRRSPKAKQTGQLLKGWQAIGSYLGIGAAAAQRWAKNGMPVRREGRFTVADADEIRRWLGREAHMPAPAYLAQPDADVAAALKQSLAAAKRQKRSR